MASGPLMTRRTLIRTGALSAAGIWGASYGIVVAQPDTQNTTRVTVETTEGRLEGLRQAGVTEFRGIRYAAPTGEFNRFLPPQPAVKWSGVRPAFVNGPNAPQEFRPVPSQFTWYWSKEPASEDCLAINIFTPQTTGRRPVMVWLHGGGVATGAGTAPGFDGTNLARAGDVVVVTVNHRLNVFGYLNMTDIKDERFSDSANAGLLDIVACLEWVKNNIAQFGGDAGNVTIFGQSGGASKLGYLTAMPAAKGLYHKAIFQSGGFRSLAPEKAIGASSALLDELQIKSSPEKLKEISVETLLRAMRKIINAQGFDGFQPSADGRSIRERSYATEAPAVSADVPFLIGTVEDEANFYLALDMKNFEMDRTTATRLARTLVGGSENQAGTLLASYQELMPEAKPYQLYGAAFTDRHFRFASHRGAAMKTALGAAPAYMYRFNWKSPSLGGLLGTPHTVDVPFAFGNVDLVPELCGDVPDRHIAQRNMMQTWVAFARTGNPSTPSAPAWQSYDAAKRHGMFIDAAFDLHNGVDKPRCDLIAPFWSYDL